MKFQIKPYILVAMLSLTWLLSCDDEDFEQATVTFYPALEAAASEPATGTAGAPVHVVMKTSRVLASPSQVNIRIAGTGAGYGFSYTTTPAMLQPGILTLTIPAGESDASFDFIPRNDEIFIPTDYQYEFTVEGTSNSIKSVGQGVFRLSVKDNTTPFLSYNFDDCGETAIGFTEKHPEKGNFMTANVWGCSDFGYPNETTASAEANAYGKGGTAPANAYLIMNTPIDAAAYTRLYVSALVYSRHTGQGQLKFLYSTNYNGTDDPEGKDEQGKPLFVWTELPELNGMLPAPGSQAWQPVGQFIESPGTGTIYIAIQFAGGTSGSSSDWRIENLEFKGI